MCRAGLTRWRRIEAVRVLSTGAIEEKGELGKISNKYARQARSSVEEQQRARRIQAGQIFARQVAQLPLPSPPPPSSRINKDIITGQEMHTKGEITPE